jgi:hypothetical protein
LQQQIFTKHPLIGTDDIPQLWVKDLVSDLDARATKDALASGLADKVTTTQLNTSLENRPTDTDVATLLATKEDVLVDGSVPQSFVIGLATSLSNLQTQINETATGELPDGSVAISKVGNLRTELDDRATLAALAAGLATKEDVLVDEGVPQSRIAGLTTKLASLQAGVDAPVIADGSLTIAKTQLLREELDDRATLAALTAGLETKEPTLVDGGVPESRVASMG